MGWQTICAYVIILPMLAYGMSELLKKRDDVNTTGYLWDFVCTNAAALRDSAVMLLREASKTFVSSDAAAWISHTGIKSQYDMLVSTTKPFVLGAEKATREMLNKTVLVLRMAIYEIETQRSLPSMAVAGHLEREAHIRFMSEKVQDAIIKLAVKYKLQEDDARPHVVRVISGTGSVFLAAGDLCEKYPILIHVLGSFFISWLIPDNWLLLPFFLVTGFGPKGPVRGSIASRSQRRIFGPAVPKGSWFSSLQQRSSKGWVARIYLLGTRTVIASILISIFLIV